MERKDGQSNSIVPFEWALKDLTRPTLQEMGLDLRDVYKNLKKIAQKAVEKKKKDGISNKRVALEVLRSGAITDSEICAEYFGGILASSMSEDGKDDSGVYYLDVIKSLSSNQLKLHYIIYRILNILWMSMDPKKERPNVGKQSDLGKHILWFRTFDLEADKLDMRDAVALYSKGLISDYKTDQYKLDDTKVLLYTTIKPTILGVQLYAVVYNKLELWRRLPLEDFGNFPDIKLPAYFAFSIDELLTKAGFKKDEQKEK